MYGKKDAIRNNEGGQRQAEILLATEIERRILVRQHMGGNRVDRSLLVVDLRYGSERMHSPLYGRRELAAHRGLG